MTVAEIATIAGAAFGGLAAGVGGMFARTRIKNGKATCPLNAGDGLRAIGEAMRDQTRMLAEIRDIMIETRGEARLSAMEQGHVQKSVEALHRRVDDALARCKQ